MSTDFDFRALCALCAELVQALVEYDGANPYHEHRALITRAQAAQAQPQPPAESPSLGSATWHAPPMPTDEEICEMVEAQQHLSDLGELRIGVAPEDVPDLVRDALARWGSTTTAPIAATNMGEHSDA